MMKIECERDDVAFMFVDATCRVSWRRWNGGGGGGMTAARDITPAATHRSHLVPLVHQHGDLLARVGRNLLQPLHVHAKHLRTRPSVTSRRRRRGCPLNRRGRARATRRRGSGRVVAGRSELTQ